MILIIIIVIICSEKARNYEKECVHERIRLFVKRFIHPSTRDTHKHCNTRHANENIPQQLCSQKFCFKQALKLSCAWLTWISIHRRKDKKKTLTCDDYKLRWRGSFGVHVCCVWFGCNNVKKKQKRKTTTHAMRNNLNSRQICGAQIFGIWI